MFRTFDLGNNRDTQHKNIGARLVGAARVPGASSALGHEVRLTGLNSVCRDENVTESRVGRSVGRIVAIKTIGYRKSLGRLQCGGDNEH